MTSASARRLPFTRAACGAALAVALLGLPAFAKSGAARVVAHGGDPATTTATATAGAPARTAQQPRTLDATCVRAGSPAAAVAGRWGARIGVHGAVPDASACPSGHARDTAPPDDPAGSFTASGTARLGGSWRPLAGQRLRLVMQGSPQAPSWDSGGSYRLTMSDEFTAPGVDDSTWERGWFLGLGESGTTLPANSDELACYNSANVSQPGDGYLHLSLTDVASTCGRGRSRVTKSYTGSLVDTRQSFRQAGGSIEARVFIPSTAAGMASGWPAFWLNGPDPPPWPEHGEIDIVEGRGGTTSAHLHYTDGSGDQAPSWVTPNAYVGWHTFGAHWDRTAGTVTLYWDGRPIATDAAMTAAYREYLVFDLTMDSASLVDSFPVTMLVDWVRVWR